MVCKTYYLSLPILTLAYCSVAHAKEATPAPTLNDQFLNAIELRDRGDLFQAIDILKHLLNTSPRLNRARLELAVAYYRAALFKDARKAAEIVLNAPGTPTQVKDTVQLFLSEVIASNKAAQQKRHTNSGIITVGLGHDDNVNIGPNSSFIDIDGVQLALQPDSAPQTDLFGLTSLQLNHSYRIPGLFKLGSGPIKTLWQSVFGIYRKQYNTKKNFHVDVLSIGTGGAFLSQTSWRANLGLQADYIRLGDETLARYTSLSPSYTMLQNRSEITFKADWLHREFYHDRDKNMEGDLINLDIELIQPINDKWTTQLNAGIYNQDAKDSAESYDAYELSAGLYWQGWKEGLLYTKATHTRSDYSGEDTLFARSRNEHENRIELGINHDFNKGGLTDWGLNAEITYTENHSNIDLYNYDRMLFVIQANRKF